MKALRAISVLALFVVFALGLAACGESSSDSQDSNGGPPEQISPVAAGHYHTVALKTDGTVWAWGYNEQGQLGDGTKTDRHIPVQVNGLTNVAAVDARGFQTVALKSDGTVWRWGWDYTATPALIDGLTDVEAVAAGWNHIFALKTDGTLWGWGNNGYGQLGDGTKMNREDTPVPVTGLKNASAVAAGYWHTVALKTDGTVWAWGYNGFGQLGDGTTVSSSTPVLVNGITGVAAVAAGDYHTLALKTDGTVWAWGGNWVGQLGDGTTTQRTTPVLVSGLTNAAAVAAGKAHTVALKTDGTLWAWGRNSDGQLGNVTLVNGTRADSSIPVPVTGLTNAAAVAAGTNHNVALKTDGTLWAWGQNNYSQLGDGTTVNSSTPVLVNGLTQ